MYQFHCQSETPSVRSCAAHLPPHSALRVPHDAQNSVRDKPKELGAHLCQNSTGLRTSVRPVTLSPLQRLVCCVMMLAHVFLPVRYWPRPGSVPPNLRTIEASSTEPHYPLYVLRTERVSVRRYDDAADLMWIVCSPFAREVDRHTVWCWDTTAYS